MEPSWSDVNFPVISFLSLRGTKGAILLSILILLESAIINGTTYAGDGLRTDYARHGFKILFAHNCDDVTHTNGFRIYS